MFGTPRTSPASTAINWSSQRPEWHSRPSKPSPPRISRRTATRPSITADMA